MFTSSKAPSLPKRTTTRFAASKELQQRSHALIPGGAHTYAKGDDQYPVEAPGFIVRGKGCHVWDVDGNEFIEYGMGLRAVTLGHAYEPVVEAANRQMRLGLNFTRPAAIEVECAEEVLSVIETAEMIKFSKNGSDVNNAAVRLARAFTGRNMVAICADHPFFSVDDWFIGSTEMNAGIPKAIQDLTVKFAYNDPESLRTLFAKYPGDIACVMLEPETTEEPRDEYLRKVNEICRQHGALLILDEMITGFRWDIGGAQKLYGVTPDLSTFGKAMGNGFSMAAIVGKREVMQQGGINHAGKRVFLNSTTHGAETSSLAAVIETIRIYKREPVIEHLHRQGNKLKKGIDQIARELHIEEYFQILGRSCNLVYATKDANKERSQEFRTLFLQETINRGLLIPSMVVSYSHTDEDIDSTIEKVGESLAVYKKALEDGVEKYLVGRPVRPVFRKFN